MVSKDKNVEFFERRLAVQSVIDRIIEYGQDYVRSLDKLNTKFEMSDKHRIVEEHVTDN